MPMQEFENSWKEMYRIQILFMLLLSFSSIILAEIIEGYITHISFLYVIYLNDRIYLYMR